MKQCHLLQHKWTDLEGTILREISQTEKDKYHIISLICGILKKKTIKFMDVENRLTVARGRG